MTLSQTHLIKATNTLSFNPAPFKPPFWLANPHLQTILPKFFAPAVPKYRRVMARDSLNESDIAFDFYDADQQAPANKRSVEASISTEATPLVVLFHGMEGSSDSHYARALAHHVHAQGWDFVVAHFRSCGGVPASGRVFYNAGDTDEVHHALLQLTGPLLESDSDKLQNQNRPIYAVGVSLGGNALAKYMGEYGDKALCMAAAAISAPVDMSSAAMNMHSFISHRVYTPYLLNPIIKKALANDISREEITAIKAAARISDFDHIFTAPRHGYRSKNDYYRRSSALPFLLDVTKPLLLISAKDDPFIGFTATPQDVSDSVTLLETEHGGHIGYLRYTPTASLPKQAESVPQNHRKTKQRTKNFDINWVPETVVAYFQSL